MLFIHTTVSLCNECYRHIPAIVYEDEGSILIKKNCPEHGESTGIVEVDPAFYYSLEHHRDVSSFNQVLFEASDRCQLTCPHCYHLPDNKIKDVQLDILVSQINQFPKDSSPMIAGAEPTLRPDFVDLCNEMNKLDFEQFELLTNGLRFASEEFTDSCYQAGLKTVCFGLNHPSYQGETVHGKQLTALTNLVNRGYAIGYVGYTIEDYEHLEFILNEIKAINNPQINHYRIRCGSFIGRSSDQQRSYLSTLVAKINVLTNGEITPYLSDDNPYHVMVNWNGIILRLIQWPDVTNIDLEELATGPWCQFYDGPISNFVHQVITRDAYKNKGLPQLDIIPVKYQYRTMTNSSFVHWKTNWAGPTPFTQFDWSLEDNQLPGKQKIVLPIQKK
jgi:uncharacterized radical SAM superfamily Fe-S cluster-containing enzyme